MAFAGSAAAGWRRDATGDEAFEATDSRYWGYLIGTAVMLPVMLTIYLLLQH